MSSDSAVRIGYVEAVDELCLHIARALTDEWRLGWLEDYASEMPDRGAAVAAVRVLGADVLAAHLLRRVPPTGGEIDLLVESLRLFPHTEADTADAVVDAAATLLGWQDWALARAMACCQLTPPAVLFGRRLGPVPPDPGWLACSTWLAGLAVHALPGLDGPAWRVARDNPLAVARGATRAVLRRDYPGAAGLVRWLALLRRRGIALPLDPGVLIEHIGLVGDEAPRLVLDVAIAGFVSRSAER